MSTDKADVKAQVLYKIETRQAISRKAENLDQIDRNEKKFDAGMCALASAFHNLHGPNYYRSKLDLKMLNELVFGDNQGLVNEDAEAYKPGVPNLWPAGHIQPTKALHPALSF